MWAAKADAQLNPNNINWTEITRNNIKRIKSPIMKKACYLEIKKGELFGTYVISEDLILNKQFYDEKSYLDFILG
jgi:hypothetical protein